MPYLLLTFIFLGITNYSIADPTQRPPLEKTEFLLKGAMQLHAGDEITINIESPLPISTNPRLCFLIGHLDSKKI